MHNENAASRPSLGTAMIRRLRRTDLLIDTIELARFLIGKMFVHDLRGQRTSGRIVETEAGRRCGGTRVQG